MSQIVINIKMKIQSLNEAIDGVIKEGCLYILFNDTSEIKRALR